MEASHALSHLCEAKIKNMGNAGRNGGEYYTPRPLIRTMMQVVQPRIGERIYHDSCGSVGFLYWVTLLIGIGTADGAKYSSSAEAVLTTAGLCLPGLAMLAWGTYLNLHAQGTARNVTREQERIERERPYLPAPSYDRTPTDAPAPTYPPAPTYGSPPAQLAPWLAPPEIPSGQNRPDGGLP